MTAHSTTSPQARNGEAMTATSVRSHSTESLIQNEMLLRIEALRRWLDPQGRKVDQECGHPDVIQGIDYQYKYERGDIAKRVVNFFPEETWSQMPEIYESEESDETEFELAWKELNETFHILPVLLRGDVLSGIGRFGVLLLGIDDGKQLLEPLEGIDLVTGKPEDDFDGKRQLLYIRPLQENYCQIHALNADVTNPRFGQPEVYQLRFLNSVLGNQNMVSMRCHWTRVIHLCDNRTDSEIFGEPRMKVVWDRLADLHKIGGGSAEMFWKGGFPGLSLQTHPNMPDVSLDLESIKGQMEEYQEGLRRYLATSGMDVKSLATEVASPEKHAELHLKLVAAAMGVPWRIFIGSEAAHLASSQDAVTFLRRVERRREDYVTPFLIRPFVDRLIHIGVLPKPKLNNGKYLVAWEDMATPSDTEKADVAQKRTAALFQYVTGGVDSVVPPFHYLRDILGMDEDEVNTIMEGAMEHMANPGDNPLHPLNNPHDPNNPINAPVVGPKGVTKIDGYQVAPMGGSVGPNPRIIGAGNPVPNPKDQLKPTRQPPTGASVPPGSGK